MPNAYFMIALFAYKRKFYTTTQSGVGEVKREKARVKSINIKIDPLRADRHYYLENSYMRKPP